MPSHDEHPTTRWAIHFLALVGVVLALKYGRLMIMPVVISLMLATALWPAVSYLNRNWHVPRAIAGMMVMLGVVTCVGLFVAWTAFKLQEVYLQFPPIQSVFPAPPSNVPSRVEPRKREDDPAKATPPTGAGNAAEVAKPTQPAAPGGDGAGAGKPAVEAGIPPPAQGDTPYDKFRRRLADIIDAEAANQLMPPNHQESIIFRNVVPVVTAELNAMPGYLAAAMEQILFISFLVLFILVEGEMLIHRTIEVFGTTTGAGPQGAVRALQNMAKQVRAYLLWRTFLNVGLALVLGFVYKYVLGMTFPWVWAILTGVLTYVPYLGPIVAGVPAMLDALISPTGGFFTAFATGIILVVVFTLEGYVIFPLVVGRNMEMNGTTTLLACLFWWLVWGNIGLFLAMPLTGAIRAICQNVPGWEPWANLMSMEKHAPRGWLRRKLDFVLRSRAAPVANPATAAPSVNGEPETGVVGEQVREAKD